MVKNGVRRPHPGKFYRKSVPQQRPTFLHQRHHTRQSTGVPANRIPGTITGDSGALTGDGTTVWPSVFNHHTAGISLDELRRKPANCGLIEQAFCRPLIGSGGH